MTKRPAALTNAAHVVLQVATLQFDAYLLSSRGLQARQIGHAQLRVGPDQAPAGIGELECQRAAWPGADDVADADGHARSKWCHVGAAPQLRSSAQIGDLRHGRHSAHPAHRDQQFRARPDRGGIENVVVVLNPGPVVEALQIALGQIPGVVSGAHDIGEVLGEQGRCGGEAADADEEYRERPLPASAGTYWWRR